MDDVERDGRPADLAKKLTRPARHREQDGAPAKRAGDLAQFARSEIVGRHLILAPSREAFYRLRFMAQAGFSATF